jgi:hypothetical protein
MAYGQDVPIVHASSGMRRIAALSYFLLWTWYEHTCAAKLLRSNPANQVIILIDEIESHLHPSWQREIVPAVFSAIEEIHHTAQVQLITATHSPLVMASLEPHFDVEKDQWFGIDFDEDKRNVVIQSDTFRNYGTVDRWLTGTAFGLTSTRATEIQLLLDKAAGLMYRKNRTEEEIIAMTDRLLTVLSPRDSFLIQWNFFCAKEGIIR